MHILQHRLASVRRRWRFVIGFRGLCALTALVVGAAALSGLADYYVHLPSLVRAYGLVAILTGAGYVAYRWMAQPLATRCDDLSLALRIEEAYPELNDALASTVQFIEAENTPGSVAMRNRAIDKACDATSDLDFGRILDRRGMLWCLGAAVAACAVAGHFLWHHPDLSRTALLRLAEPFGHHTWTRINLDNVPTRIAVGQPFPLHGVVEGIVPPQVKIEVEGQHPKDHKFEKRAEKVVPLKLDSENPRAARIVTGLDMTQHRGKFRFRVVGNDGRFPPTQAWHEVEVLPPPAFAMLDGLPSPQITLYPPEYTDLPSPQKLSPGTRPLEVNQGTHVVFRAAIDRPLSAAWIDLKPLDAGARLAPWLSLVMQPQGGEALGVLAMQQAIAGRYPASLDETGKLLQVEFMPWASGSYVLHLVDADGLAKDYEADLLIKLDPVPVVQMLRPTSSVSLLPDAEIVFRVLAEDDFFAIRSVYLEMRQKAEDGQEAIAPRRLTMYDPALAGWVMSRLMPGPLPTPWVGPELRLRPRRLELAKVLALNGEFKEGDVLLIQACSEDFCNIVTPRAPGRSPEIEIRIVGKSDLAKMIDEGLGQVQQELVRLQKLQQDAMDLVKDVEKQKPGPKAMDQLIEAEQLQKQIQERIGNRQDEGLREQLQKLDHLVKDNKLPPTDAIDNLKQLQTELNRLAQEELPKIDQKLDQARKEMAGTQKQAPEKSQKSEKKGSPLKQAGKLQEQAKNALDELARTLDKWADIDVVKHQVREAIANQKALRKRTEQLKTDQEAMGKDGDPKKRDEFKDNLGQQKQVQEDLAKTTEDLQTRMQKVLEQQDKGGKEFSDLGSKLKKAGRLDEKERAQAFREIAKEARDLSGKQKEEAAKETLNDLAQDLEQTAKQLDTGKMPEDEQNAFKRQAENKVKQAQNQAMPGPIKNLKEAVKIGEDSNVPQKMRDAADDLKKPNLDKARANQDEAVKNLQEMLAALEGQNDDGLERLRKKQKELTKAGDDVDKLEKRTKEARNNKDPKQRADELRKLAEEARRNARELARLQEEKASQELKRAAQMLEDAADKMQQGDQAGAEELEQEAMERIEEARKNLDEFQEELSREQLAKIADRLKGLKERQDAAVERTAEFQKRLLAKKEWTNGFKQTLDADRMTQEGLAEETRSLQEKIKEAKVFEHVMDKAAKAMEKAAEAMSQRREEATRRQPQLDDEDVKDETRRHEEIAKLQKQGADRLQRLLDALKEEQVAQEKKDQEQQPMDGGDEQQQARPRPADGIPPMAELKALRAEQVEVNERTKELAQRHPKMNDLPEPARRELTELETEQRRLREIFAGMTAKKEGDMP